MLKPVFSIQEMSVHCEVSSGTHHNEWHHLRV